MCCGCRYQTLRLRSGKLPKYILNIETEYNMGRALQQVMA